MLMSFSTSTRFVQTFQLSLYSSFFATLVDVKRQRVIKTKWGAGYKFSHKNGLKFSKKVGIFPEMGVSLKKVFTFCAGLLMQRFLEVSPGFIFSASPNSPLIKWRALISGFLGLGHFIGPFLKFFLPAPCIVDVSVFSVAIVYYFSARALD